jgi:tetratricopeptide (TPR) repeat protein
MMGQVKESLSLAKQAFQLTQDLSYDAQFTAYIVRNRGLAEATAGNLAAALTDLREAMKLYEKLDDSYRVGLCHNELGICLAQQGNLNAGIHHFKQAVRLFEVLGNANDLANTLNSLGTSLCLGGHYQEALQYFRECQDVATQVGAVRRVAYALAGIGDAYFGLQDYEQAIDSYTHATNLARDLGIRVLENYTQVKQGDCYFARQDYQQALRLANQTAEIATEIGLRFELGLARTLQAKIAVQKTEYEASFSLFASAINNFTQNDVLEQAKVRLWWSYALLLSWREAKALEQLQTAMTLIQQWEELLASLATTVQETRRLLLHFLHQPITALGTRDQIYTLLFYNNQPIDLSEQDLQVFAFGPPRLLVAGSPKQFVQRGGPSKAPEFLLYLILHSKQGGSRWSDVSVELWPDEPTDKVSDLFHQQLKRLRRSTFNNCDDYLIRQHDYYQINLDWLSWCDALIFDTLFEQASQAEGEEALSLRLELIALYQGEFLAGFELSEWGMTCRTNYEIRFLEAVRMASQQLLATGESQEAINVIGRGLELDYFREDLHRSALQAYAQMGMYDHLTDYYAELRQTFKREFGCPPDVETQTIYQQLLTQR